MRTRFSTTGRAAAGVARRAASLLAHILRFGVGPQAVLTQLSLAVGVLALHMDEWHSTVVTDLITSLTTPPEQAMAKLPCLLELLTVLPEEAENYKVGVLPRSRENFRAMLRTNSPQVFQLRPVCKQCQSQANAAEGQALLERILRAAHVAPPPRASPTSSPPSRCCRSAGARP